MSEYNNVMNIDERIEAKLVELDLIERYGTDIDGSERNNDNSKEIQGVKQLLREALEYVKPAEASKLLPADQYTQGFNEGVRASIAHYENKQKELGL